MLADAVPIPGEQGHCGGAGAEEAALVLGLEAAVFKGRAPLHAADAHHHTHSVGYDFGAGVAGVGAGLPERGYGGHHQVGVDGGQGGVADVQVVQGAGGAAFHYQVNLSRQFPEQAAAGGGVQVEGDALFVEVEDEEKEAAFRVGVVAVEGCGAAHCRALGGFDFEDIGAVVGQEARAEGAGDVLAQIQYLDAG